MLQFRVQKVKQHRWRFEGSVNVNETGLKKHMTKRCAFQFILYQIFPHNQTLMYKLKQVFFNMHYRIPSWQTFVLQK